MPGGGTHVGDDEGGGDAHSQHEARVVAAEDLVVEREGGELGGADTEVEEEVAGEDDLHELDDYRLGDLGGGLAHVAGGPHEGADGDTQAEKLRGPRVSKRYQCHDDAWRGRRFSDAPRPRRRASRLLCTALSAISTWTRGGWG